MYLKNDGFAGYDRSGQQIRQRGLFLMLIEPEGSYDGEYLPKACVRKVALRQLGNWMIGRVRIYGRTYTVSGAYGADGLFMSIPKEVYDRLPVTLPVELYQAWKHGGGWNSAGKEASDMRKWALANLDALRK